MFNFKNQDEEQDQDMMGDEKSAKIKLLDQLIDQLQGMGGDDSKEDAMEMGPDMDKDPIDDGDHEMPGGEMMADKDMMIKDKYKGMK